MISGSLTSTLRPIRIAFVIPPWDRAAALQAMRISSFLWGGFLNPIIPFHRRLDRHNPFFRGAKTTGEVFDGYLQAYDPDFVVRLGATKRAKVSLGRYHEIDGDEILSNIPKNGSPRYGVGLFEILDHLFNEEFRFLRRQPLPLEIPDVQNSLLWTSIFGGLITDLQPDLNHRLDTFPDHKKVFCDKENYLEILRPGNLFLRRITSYDLQFRPKGFRNDWIYLMDGSSVEDVVFYWNLRALGWQILPMPVTTKDNSGIESSVAKYIEDYHREQSVPSPLNYTTLLKAPSIKEAEFPKFFKSLKSNWAEGNNTSKLATQSWIPRLWNEWDQRQNGGERSGVTVKDIEVKLTTGKNRFYIPSLLPDFAEDYTSHGTPRCANELEPQIYGETGTYAEVIPEGGESLAQAVSRYSSHDLRCSANGLVYYPRYPKWEHELEPPLANAVFQAWFQERGWETALSDNGYIVKHVLKQFGGTWGTNWLTNEAVFKLLSQIATDNWIEGKAFRGLIHKTAKTVQFLDAARLTKWLVDSNIVKLGLELTCPQCRQRSWFSISETDYEVECRQCLEVFRLPTETPEKIRWAYRGNGAFMSRHGTQGGLAVILTLRLFSRPSADQVTPMFSFTAKKDREEMEIDLAIHTRRIRGGFPERNVLFAECKSYNEFQKEDIVRMEAFTQSFPGTAMVFATLRRDLTPAEVTMLTRLAKRILKQRSKGEAFSSLVLLTGNELFNTTEVWDTWKKLGGRFAKYGQHPVHGNEIEALAEATQFLYLGFESRAFLRSLQAKRLFR